MWLESLAGGISKGQDEIQGRKEPELQAAEGNNSAEQCPVWLCGVRVMGCSYCAFCVVLGF